MQWMKQYTFIDWEKETRMPFSWPFSQMQFPRQLQSFLFLIHSSIAHEGGGWEIDFIVWHHVVFSHPYDWPYFNWANSISPATTLRNLKGEKEQLLLQFSLGSWGFWSWYSGHMWTCEAETTTVYPSKQSLPVGPAWETDDKVLGEGALKQSKFGSHSDWLWTFTFLKS